MRIPLYAEGARGFTPPATQSVLPGLLGLRDAKGAKTMPLRAVSEDQAEVGAGRRCRGPSPTGARGERRAGREQPEEAAGDETCLTMRGLGSEHAWGSGMSMMGAWPSSVGSARDDCSPVLIGIAIVSPGCPVSRRLPRWYGRRLPSPSATSPHRPQTSHTLRGLSHAPVDDI